MEHAMMIKGSELDLCRRRAAEGLRRQEQGVPMTDYENAVYAVAAGRAGMAYDCSRSVITKHGPQQGAPLPPSRWRPKKTASSPKRTRTPSKKLQTSADIDRRLTLLEQAAEARDSRRQRTRPSRDGLAQGVSLTSPSPSKVIGDVATTAPAAQLGESWLPFEQKAQLEAAMGLEGKHDFAASTPDRLYLGVSRAEGVALVLKGGAPPQRPREPQARAYKGEGPSQLPKTEARAMRLAMGVDAPKADAAIIESETTLILGAPDRAKAQSFAYQSDVAAHRAVLERRGENEDEF